MLGVVTQCEYSHPGSLSLSGVGHGLSHATRSDDGPGDEHGHALEWDPAAAAASPRPRRGVSHERAVDWLSLRGISVSSAQQFSSTWYSTRVRTCNTRSEKGGGVLFRVTQHAQIIKS